MKINDKGDKKSKKYKRVNGNVKKYNEIVELKIKGKKINKKVERSK